MDQKIQTSFIPKRQSEARGAVTKAKRPMTLFNWLSGIVFILAVLLTVGFFSYERLTISRNKTKASIIENEIQALDPELTEELGVVKSRVDLGKRFLSAHLALSSLFSLIEESTVRNIYFSEFDLETNPGEKASIKAKGEAPSYAVLNFQSKIFRDSNLVSNVSFLNMNLNDRGAVNFELTAEVDPVVASYKEKLEPSLEATEETPDQLILEEEDQTEN